MSSTPNSFIDCRSVAEEHSVLFPSLDCPEEHNCHVADLEKLSCSVMKCSFDCIAKLSHEVSGSSKSQSSARVAVDVEGG